MSYGLEVYNAAGNKTLSVTDRLTRMHQVYSGNIGPLTTINISVSGLALDNTWGAHLNSWSTSGNLNAIFVKMTLSAGNIKLENTHGTETVPYSVLVYRF